MDHVRHLEELVAYRERIVVERDAQLAAIRAERAADRAAMDAQAAEHRQLEAALAAQQRLLAFRNSLVGWLRWPPMRARLLWRQWTGR
jgi:hypothetical protein